MTKFEKYLLEGKAKAVWLGVCNKVRESDKGELFWQEMMKHKKRISEKQFLSKVDPSNVLDTGETWEDYVNERSSNDPDFGFYKSVGGAYFFQYAGFEYIWKINENL